MAEHAKYTDLGKLTAEELIEVIKRDNAEHEAFKQEAADTVAELKTQLKVGGTADNPITTVTIDGKLFKFTNQRFTRLVPGGGEEITAAEAATDEAFCKELLEKKSTLLVPV